MSPSGTLAFGYLIQTAFSILAAIYVVSINDSSLLSSGPASLRALGVLNWGEVGLQEEQQSFPSPPDRSR